MKLDVNLPGCR